MNRPIDGILTALAITAALDKRERHHKNAPHKLRNKSNKARARKAKNKQARKSRLRNRQ